MNMSQGQPPEGAIPNPHHSHNPEGDICVNLADADEGHDGRALTHKRLSPLFQNVPKMYITYFPLVIRAPDALHMPRPLS